MIFYLFYDIDYGGILTLIELSAGVVATGISAKFWLSTYGYYMDYMTFHLPSLLWEVAGFYVVCSL